MLVQGRAYRACTGKSLMVPPSLVDFIGDADALAAILKALPRQEGFDEITLPGERPKRTEILREKFGIPIWAKLWEELRDNRQRTRDRVVGAIFRPSQ